MNTSHLQDTLPICINFLSMRYGQNSSTHATSLDLIWDSQQVVSKVLTAFGSKHNFHRQFNERFFASKPSQMLGMQLYELVAQDSDWWVYLQSKPIGHVFPHSTYFIPSDDPRYENLVRRNAR